MRGGSSRGEACWGATTGSVSSVGSGAVATLSGAGSRTGGASGSPVAMTAARLSVGGAVMIGAAGAGRGLRFGFGGVMTGAGGGGNSVIVAASGGSASGTPASCTGHKVATRWAATEATIATARMRDRRSRVSGNPATLAQAPLGPRNPAPAKRADDESSDRVISIISSFSAAPARAACPHRPLRP
jgi:hypothetical protein